MSRISAIIPVYNAADSLPRLIESLRMQTMRDFTAIFIDDGSTDGGIGILRDIADRDGRFVVLEGSHAGPGAARNLGLDEADRLKSEFVTFIDADDFIAKDALETAVGILDDSGFDIVHYPWVDDETLLECEIPPLSTPSIYVWNKTYRRSVIQGIRFLNSDYAEDLAYFLETDANAPQRIACDKALYVHIKRAGSLWESRNPSSVCRSMKIVIEHLSRFFAEHPDAKGRSDWIRLYLPKLMKSWKRSIRRLPRVQRKKDEFGYYRRLAELRSSGQFPLFYVSEFKFRLLVFITYAAYFFKKNMSEVINRLSATRRTFCFRLHIRRMRHARCRPIKVFFLVTEISKWKTRSLFEKMRSSAFYEPVVGIGLEDCEMHLSIDERIRLMQERTEWLSSRRIVTVPVADPVSGKALDLRKYIPDVVFYQQPWQIPARHRPAKVSRFALTFYVPYGVIASGNLETDCLLPFFRDMFCYFVQSREWAALFRNATKRKGCRFIAVGHPMLDDLVAAESVAGDRRHVIYAPHWTVRDGHSIDLYPYGTFEWNGVEILHYALRHPGWSWVFKPHPLLRSALVERGLMSREAVDEYYRAWETLGIACYDADYPRLFMDSRAMITDCGSFLVEYAVTGLPIIHLKPLTNQVEIMPPNRRLFDSYYVASDVNRMLEIFDAVLERGEDPRREDRLRAVRESGLCDRNASNRILSYLDRLFGLPVSGRNW